MPPAPSSPAVRRSLAWGGLTVAAALSLRALVRPLPDADRRLLDWEAVRRTAGERTGERGRIDPVLAGRLAEGYDALAAELAPLMADVCQARLAAYPRMTVVDRHGFVDANVVIAGRLLAPIERLRGELPSSRASLLGRRVLSRYVGEILGFMAQRVLGQYDPVLMLPAAGPGPDGEGADVPGLYLVEPNVAAFERSQRIPGEPLRRWLVLHELTHAWQFGDHPWLRDHIVGLVDELVVSGLLAPAGDRPSSRRLATRLPTAVREQLRGVGRLQAVMSLLEGYSNFVMHRVGRRHLADFDRLEEAFERRHRQRSALERLVLAVTGIGMKLRQYSLGESFAERVAEAGGLGTLNRVWSGPEMLPTMEELRDPARWMARAA